MPSKWVFTANFSLNSSQLPTIHNVSKPIIETNQRSEESHLEEHLWEHQSEEETSVTRDLQPEDDNELRSDSDADTRCCENITENIEQ